MGEIDTPESKQPYGSRARQALSDLAFGQQARVVVQDTDRYGRTVGRAYVGGTDVNAEMVKQGAAWVYRQFAKDPSLYRLEEQAKAAKRGFVGTARSRKLPALGLAAGNLQRCSGFQRVGCRNRQQRRLHLRRQAVLPGNDKLRRGEVLPDAVRDRLAGWEP